MNVKKLRSYLENLDDGARVLTPDPENVDDWNEVTVVICDDDGDVIIV